MQTVSNAWTAEERDEVRFIKHGLSVSWKRQTLINNRTFTIGISLIDGPDPIEADPGAVGTPGSYQYFDESDYVTNLEYERGLQMPVGGVSVALGSATLENTTNRFLPQYMGGSGELYTAIAPRKPMIMYGGFYVDGVDQKIPVLSGLISKQPGVDVRNREVKLDFADYLELFRNKKVSDTAVYTGVTTDVIIEDLFAQVGMYTSQYDLDVGTRPIPFAIIEKDAELVPTLNELVEAENGHILTDENGIIKFWNRDHWSLSPYTQAQRVITTAQVINAETVGLDHIINSVEVTSKVRKKSQAQKLWSLSEPKVIPRNSDLVIFADFSDENGALPVLEVYTPSYSLIPNNSSSYSTNLVATGTGATNDTGITVKSYYQFATAYKIVFSNSTNYDTFITRLDLWGRPAKYTNDIYVRKQRDLSVTAYDEHPYKIENNFIQDQDHAELMADMLLEDFAYPENIQKITIMAIPELQLGDLISWQGRNWRVYDIKAKINPSEGYVQELMIVQRTIRTYFRIGISTIEGSDVIGP